MHDGNHGHGGASPHAEAGGRQIQAVLAFLLEHNRHHASELRELSAKLRVAHRTRAAELLDGSADDMDRANEKLAEAVAAEQEANA
ncbi:MAG: hypothetical protein LBL63_03705 [Clostridiales Family XIII bacterium]|nr:hypothetical protein [Clostridiales Family XIII bacterium]